MLEADQRAAGFEHAHDLGQRGGLVVDRAQDGGGDDGVEGAALDGQRFGGAVDDRDPQSQFVGAFAGEVAEVRLGFDGDQFGDRVGVVGEVGAEAAADLQDAAGDRGEEACALLGEAAGLQLGGGGRIPAGEEGSSAACHECSSRSARPRGDGAEPSGRAVRRSARGAEAGSLHFRGIGGKGAVMPRRRMIVEGRVQGVCFRVECRREAQALGLAGWVRNRADGTVEAVFEGTAAQVEAMAAWMRHGPPQAEVDRVETVEERSEGLTGFAIR